MKTAIICILLALVFYTIAIFSERKKSVLKPWILLIFIFAFSCDLIGTSLMGINNPQSKLNLHLIFGLSALVIMLIHLLWAIQALKRKGKYQELFTRYSIWAWCLWLVAFFSGMPKHKF